MNTSSQNDDPGQPTDPKALPAGPDSVKVYVQDMTISQRWDSGASHTVNVTDCPDLDVVLTEGVRVTGTHHDIPAGNAKGVVLVLLDVDDEQDIVLYNHSLSGEVEAFGQAVETLTAARHAAHQIGKLS